MAIQSFSDKTTEDFFYDGILPAKGCGWASIRSTAARKLDMVDAASELQDLRVPPNNRLEKLRGDLADRYSIRINDQWRIVFRWTRLGPEQVRIIDYH